MGSLSFDEDALNKELEAQGAPAGVSAKQVRVLATVTRGDGTVEDLGTIAFWHADPMINLAWHQEHPDPDAPSPRTEW
jgi:hypothetical protein